MNLEELKKPFPEKDIEWRLQTCGEKNGKFWGMCLAYVTNRAIQNRLDEVVGAENWKNEFKQGPDGGILCGLSIKCGDEWVTKWDGAENTQIEAVKGGLSGAMKRAASTGWGIGRYLYNLEEGWAEITENGRFSGKTKEGKWFKWNPPKLPAWALPNNAKQPESEEVMTLKKLLEEWISTGLLKGEYLSKAEYYMNNNDCEGMNKVISWCKSQEK